MMSSQIADRLLSWFSRLLSIDLDSMGSGPPIGLSDNELAEQLHFGRG